MLFLFVVGHALADYPLQGEAMAVEKSRHSRTSLQKAVPWYYWLTAHALIHGGVVYLIVRYSSPSLGESVALTLGIAETICHWVIDFAKCESWTNIHVDQTLHIVCKIAWWGLISFGVLS